MRIIQLIKKWELSTDYKKMKMRIYPTNKKWELSMIIRKWELSN